MPWFVDSSMSKGQIGDSVEIGEIFYVKRTEIHGMMR